MLLGTDKKPCWWEEVGLKRRDSCLLPEQLVGGESESRKPSLGETKIKLGAQKSPVSCFSPPFLTSS